SSPFITETTTRVVPIGGEERRREGGGGRGRGDPMVVVTHNGDIDENGQSREKELIDPIEEENEEDDEEYIEGEDLDDEETTDMSTTVFRARLTTSRPTVPTTEATVPSTSVTVPPTRSTIPPFRETTPHWVSSIGEGEEWNDILLRGENLPPATTRKISIQRVTTTHLPSTLPSTTTASTTTTQTSTQTTTTRRPTTTRTTTTTEAPTTTTEEATSVSVRTEFPDYPSFDGFEVPTTTESTTLGTTTKMVETRRPVQSRLPTHEEMPSLSVPESFAPPPSVDYSPFDRFDPTLNGIPSLSSSNPTLSNDLPDYISFNDVDAIPIQIGHISQKGSAKSGRPNLSLLSHRRQFESLHTDSYRSTNRFFGLLLALVLIVATLPSLLLVVLGAMYYGRGSHPMDRSKLSDIIGVLSVIMSLFIFFVVPLLLLYSTIGLLFCHTHHTLCPLVQPPTDTLEDVVLVMEGCARVQTPLIRMSQSSLLAAVSAFPVAVLLLHLSNYFLRMRREHYWTHSDSDLM
ncbi:hypothetical protein PRIPAC_90777, partial [Pristionchus pacificus]|uniref:Uncharacterized protein n=1 Tax=Pristionchus pacificus TaxID=54126 RepID=A0A8R1Z9K1_PRIPA